MLVNRFKKGGRREDGRSNEVKAILKRWVLRAWLKGVLACGVWLGREFLREGMATERALSPQV